MTRVDEKQAAMSSETISRSQRDERLLGVRLPPFQAFLDRHAAELLRFLVTLLGPDEAEDCFQETCLAALRAYPSLPPDSNLRAWAFTIARRKAIDAGRAQGRRPVAVAEVPERAVAADSSSESGGWAPLAALPPKQRAAVFLRVAVELPHREVAEVLECSEEAARRSAHEGLKRLREEMA
jgi:DNA-directed RNA polymerase specialized sigma24 family protein